MKKLTTLLLAAGMVFAATAPASAVDVKFDGEYAFDFARGTGQFGDSYQDKDLDGARQRFRLGMTFTASENLSGYFQMQAGVTEWGDTKSSGAFNVETANNKFFARMAYIDWVIPQTSIKVRMGKQFIGVPGGANGKSYVHNAGVAPATGIVVSAPVLDNLGVTAYWARLANLGQDFEKVGSFSRNVDAPKYDVFGLHANYKLNGFAITPYVVYASVGEKTNGTGGFNPDPDLHADLAANAYWLGATATVTAFDPFTFKVGAAYGCKVYDDKGNAKKIQDRDGFVVDALATYKLGFGTVKALAWYGSGDDSKKAGNEKYSGMMPQVAGRFNAGSTAWNGSNLMDNFASDYTTAQGTWGIMLGLTGMSFIQDLSHDLTMTYFEGTNHSDQASAGDINRNNQYLTTEDSGVDVSFNTTYKIYKNLTTFVELGYVFADFADRGTEKYEDGWKAAWGFRYQF